MLLRVYLCYKRTHKSISEALPSNTALTMSAGILVQCAASKAIW